MAGPGGGPPRRSHTKSRKGCKTCKRRHIRCDENFPQCRNCTKHSCRCDYMDQPSAWDDQTPSPRLPDLLTTPDIEGELDAWRMSGDPPFPELRITHKSYWHRFSRTDLRLIHHIASLSLDLNQRGYSRCTVWARQMPILLAMALSCDFVLSAVLAFSASHLAWRTNNQETDHLAYHHRGVALKGLHDAIGRFAKENSEEILAASMLLSWQATEWASWASLQQGLSTVLNAMRPWLHESEIAGYIESQQLLAGSRTPGTSNFPSTQPNAEDLARLDQATAALHTLRSQLTHSAELTDRISGLLVFLQELRRDFPLQAPEEAFERLQGFRQWLFWLPPTLLRAGEVDLGPLSVLAHFFGVAVALDPLFAGIGGSYLGSMGVGPLEEVHDLLMARRSSHPHDASVATALNLIDVPRQTLNSYQARSAYVVRAPGRSASGSIPSASSHPLPPSSSSAVTTASPSHGAFAASMSPCVTAAGYAPTPLQSPPAAGSRRSSYVTTGSSGSEPRRSSGFFEPPPKTSAGPTDPNGYLYGGYGGPLAGPPASYGYDAPPLSGYGADSGFVSSSGLWA